MVPLWTDTSDPKGAPSLHIHPLILKKAQRLKGLVHFSKCKKPKNLLSQHSKKAIQTRQNSFCPSYRALVTEHP